MKAAGMAADTRVEIGPRPIPQEPLYLIINLGMSRNFGDVDLDHLTFPVCVTSRGSMLFANLAYRPSCPSTGSVCIRRLTRSSKPQLLYSSSLILTAPFSLGCDPPEFPTAAYIAQFPEAYSVSILTVILKAEY